MAEKVFVRVKDRRTKHVYDVHITQLDDEIHEELKRFPRTSRARDAKPFILSTTKASTSKVVEGVSPAK